MFTGIVTEKGRVVAVRRSAAGLRLRIDGPKTAKGLSLGGSVSVDGVCLTAVEIVRSSFSLDVIPETLRRSTLSSVAVGREVNLERPLSAAGELGGHFVQGHVDARAAVMASTRKGDETMLEIRTPRELAGLVVQKGSIAIDGVSLTVASVKRGRFSVALIPHTIASTNLGRLKAGDEVNLEADLLGKYVRALLGRRA
jgi:riboflavin synthase